MTCRALYRNESVGRRCCNGGHVTSEISVHVQMEVENEKEVDFCVVGCCVVLQVISPLVALADGEVPPTWNNIPVAPGGAAYDPSIPVPQEQIRALQEKLALAKRIQELVNAGYSVEEIRNIMHMPRLFPYVKGSALASRSDDSAWCYMQIWKEPEDQPNWCGPGSGKAVLSNWKIPPSMAYLANEAPRLLM